MHWWKLGYASSVLLALIAVALAVNLLGRSRPAGEWSDHATGESRIVIRSDGTGEVTDLPLWSGNGACVSSNYYSGSVKWRPGSRNSLVVEVPYGEIYLWPDVQFLAPNWDKLLVGICGKNTPADRLVVFGGSTTS